MATAALDRILDLDHDLLALILHWPADPNRDLSRAWYTCTHFVDYCKRLCRLLCTCKTFANRYGARARQARIFFWHRCAPSFFDTVSNGIRLKQGGPAQGQKMSDRIDFTLWCAKENRHTSTRMRRVVCHSDALREGTEGAMFQQVKHTWNVHAKVCADPHVVAATYGLEPTDHAPPTEWGAATRCMIKLPIKNLPANAGKSDGYLTVASALGQNVIRRELRYGTVASLKGTPAESVEQPLEILEIYMPRELTIRVNASGGFLLMKGTVNLKARHLDFGPYTLEPLLLTSRTRFSTEWLTAARRQAYLQFPITGLNVWWHEVVFSATPARTQPFLGVLRQRRPRVRKASTAPAQGRWAESESDSD